LGLIPDEWEVVSLGQITKIIGGGTPSRDIEEYWKNGTIPWVTVKDLHDGLLIKESEEYITEKGLESSATNLIKANNIITSTRMGIGRFYINEIDITINQDMKALFAKDSIDKQFLLWSLLHFGKKLEALGTGTTVKGILLNDLKSLKLILPLMTEQKQIAKILTKQDKKIETEETNLAKLKELKKGLMNDLLSGKVRVKV
jgi:type I restriction enzyme S subunit